MFDDVAKIYTRRTLNVPPLMPGRTERRPSRTMVAAGLSNLRRAGFGVDADLAHNFLESDRTEFLSFYNGLLGLAKEMLGDPSAYQPMYPNFPEQVASASDAELFLNAILHYVGDAVGVRITPVYDKSDRAAHTADPDRVLRLGSWDGVRDLFTTIMSSSQPFADADKADLETFVKECGARHLAQILPDAFPVKENLAVVSVLLSKDAEVAQDALAKHYRTATDVLRLATVMSGGEADLVENHRFRTFSRPERRFLLGLLERVPNLDEDMYHRADRFKRLGEKLHPGEYATRFPNTAATFDFIRAGHKLETYNSQVEALLAQATVDAKVSDELLNLLSSKPGEFARRLDHTVRINADEADQLRVVNAFMHVVSDVSVKVLVQVGNAFMNRNSGHERIAVVRGGNKVVLTEPLAPLASHKVQERVMRAVGVGLRAHFADRSPLGKTWVDPDLSHYTIPLGVQGGSESATTVGRFSRTRIADDISTLRFFIHWKDKDYFSTDLDLSALLLDDKFQDKGFLSYQNLRHGGFAFHSGDFVSAPHGAAEFVDIDVHKALDAGVRYVAMDVRNFSGTSFTGIPECFAGYMGRTEPQSGEVFEASTVANKAVLGTDANAALLYVFDLAKGEAVWCDLSISNVNSTHNSLSVNSGVVERLSKITVSNTYLTLHDLFMMHAASRGTIVKNREDADTVFGKDGLVGPFDTEAILAEYM